MSSAYPGSGDPAYPPPNQAVYSTPQSGLAPPPPYSAVVSPMTQMGVAATGETNYEWGTFSTLGLDLLRDQDSVNVTKLFNQEEALTYVDKPRRFSVTNNGTKQMFSLIENEAKMESCAHHRSFEVDAFDVTGAKAFSIIREVTNFCSYCCFCCACFGNGCKTKVKVKINDRTIGSINQDCSFNRPLFTIYNGCEYDGEELIKIEGSSACCTPASMFGLRYPHESSCSGNIKKHGSSMGGFSNQYGLHFPSMSNPELKALCIAAVVLFDYRFYNRPPPPRRR